MLCARPILILAFLAAVSTARAHDTFLAPVSFVAASGAGIALDLTSGMAFPKLETAIKPERVERALLRDAGGTVDLPPAGAGPQSLRFQAVLRGPGVATLGVVLKPRELELTSKQVAHYLDEISASAEVRKRWATLKQPARWRERYTKHAKTLVAVGPDAASDRTWTEPLGLRLEIVPLRSPAELRAGEEFPVRVLKDGSPLAGFPLNLLAAGQRKGETRVTDAEGRVTFRLARKGAHLLRGTELRAASGTAIDWESDFTTLTFHVR